MPFEMGVGMHRVLLAHGSPLHSKHERICSPLNPLLVLEILQGHGQNGRFPFGCVVLNVQCAAKYHHSFITVHPERLLCNKIRSLY